MASACCDEQKKYTKGLLARSITLIVLGALLLIPAIEAFFSVGIAGYLGFAGMSALLGYSIFKDFPKKSGYALGMMVALGLALSVPLLPAGILPAIALSISFVMGASLLFVRDETWVYMKQWFKHAYNSKKHPKPKKPSSFFELPSVEKVVLLSAGLNWGVSLASFFAPLKALYEYVLHDALLTLGVFNAGAWVKKRMQTSALSHNHQKLVTVFDPKKNTERKVPIAKLKKGMVLKIEKETFLPVPCEAMKAGCLISNDSAEKREPKKAGSKIEANTLYYKGYVRCMADYKPIDHNYQKANADSKDTLLRVFLTLSLCVALGAGLWSGVAAASLVVGLQVFCLNLMVSCPCVFLVAKPMIHSKVLDWVQKEKSFQFNKMPSKGKPDIVVFDRTHTLYEENPNNPGGPYVLNKGTKKLLTDLKARGVEVYILSGHGTDGWKEHLQDCRQELNGLVKPENIIFNKKYHDHEKGAKKDIICNLQRYGQIEKPKKSIFSPVKSFFRRKTVAMIGDGSNDTAAMKQADLAICVSKEKSSLNDNVAKEANFFVQQRKLSSLPGLIDALGKGKKRVNLFTGVALSYNVLMLAMVNGLFAFLFGVAFPPAGACLAVAVFCVAVVAATSLVKIKTKSTLAPEAATEEGEGEDESHACCACEHDHDHTHTHEHHNHKEAFVPARKVHNLRLKSSVSSPAPALAPVPQRDEQPMHKRCA